MIVLTGSCVSSARAECGDYVVRGEKASNEHTSPTAMAALQSGQHHQPSPMRHDSPYAPCHGPHCSKGSPSPSVPPTSVSPRVEHWGDLITSSCIPDSESIARRIEELSHLPRPFTLAIYHPPRTSTLRSSS
jgi:hypothetical protein